MLTLHKSGWKNSQVYDNCYECLTSTHCVTFNSEMTVYKNAHHLEIDIDKVLVKAREEYRMLVTNRTWISTRKSTGRHTYISEPHKKRAKSHHSDISALVVKTEQNEILVE